MGEMALVGLMQLGNIIKHAHLTGIIPKCLNDFKQHNVTP